MNDKKVALFNFDGTIADTIGAYMELCNDVLEEMGHRKITSEEIERV